MKSVKSPHLTFQVLAYTCFLSVHGDHRWVRSFSSFKSLLSEGQPHVLWCDFDEVEWFKRQTPIFILKVRIQGHGCLFTYAEDLLFGEAWWNRMHNPEYDIEWDHVAKHACCRKIDHQFLQKHPSSLAMKSRFHGVSCRNCHLFVKHVGYRPLGSCLITAAFKASFKCRTFYMTERAVTVFRFLKMPPQSFPTSSFPLL